MRKAGGILLVLLAGVIIFSCKTAKIAGEAGPKPMSTGKIIREIEDNAIDYEYFSIKRINCQFSDGNTKTSFRANLKSLRDEIIVVSFNKINIPVGRVLLTPDSIVYINYVDKNYFSGDYRLFNEIFHVNIGFRDIQSVLSNNAFSYRNDSEKLNLSDFTSYIDSGLYVLQSVKNRKLHKIEDKNKTRKVERRLNKLDEDAFIIQSLFVHPLNFNLARISIEDRTNAQHVVFGFDEYVKMGKKDYPGTIEMDFRSEASTINLRLKMGGFTMEKISDFNFRIPSRYERIYLN